MPDNLLIAIAALGNLLFPDFCPMSLFPQPVRGLHRQGDQSPDVPQPINLYIPKTHLLSLSLKIFSKQVIKIQVLFAFIHSFHPCVTMSVTTWKGDDHRVPRVPHNFYAKYLYVQPRMCELDLL